MSFVYRFGFGRWALLCVLFLGGVTLAMQRYTDGFDHNVQPSTTSDIPPQEFEATFPCQIMVYSISEDGVQYVHENGGGTVFAARLNQQVGFYQLNPYGYMMPVEQTALDGETAGRLSKALLQCQGPWLPSATWFHLSAQVEPGKILY
jgi:hypothetical protein